MNKYDGLARIILNNIGGKNNVISVTHCITRLRFKLADESKANTEVLENTDGIMKVIKSGGQYQIVIGQAVGQVFEAVLSVGKLSSKAEGRVETEEKQTPLNALLGIVTAIFTPFIGVLCASGMMKGLCSAAVALGWLAKTDGAYILWFNCGNALFYFLPAVIAFTAAKKFKMHEITGMILGLTMCYPAIVNIASGSEVLGSFLGNDYYMRFFGIPVILPGNGSYTSSVLPAILMIWVAARIEKWLKNHLPNVVQTFLVPFFTLAITVPLAFIVIGPLANTIAGVLTGVTMFVYNLAPWLEGLVLGLIHQGLTSFGLHWCYSPLRYNNFATLGYDTLITPNFGGCFTQMAAAAAVMVKTRDKKLKGICAPAVLSGLFGISEPALYSVNMPLKVPFICGSIGCGLSGAVIGWLRIKIYSGGSGIFALANFIDPNTGDMTGMFQMAACLVFGCAIAFILTLLFYKEKQVARTEKATVDSDGTEQENAGQETETIVCTPVRGIVMELAEVGDGVFSEGIIGPGCAVKPEEDVIRAPFDGTIYTVAETGHAVGMVSKEGAELLLHIGLDTVKMQGQGFETLVKAGQEVKSGQELVRFDREQIAKAGYSDVIMVLVTNADKNSLKLCGKAKRVIAAGEPLMKV